MIITNKYDHIAIFALGPYSSTLSKADTKLINECYLNQNLP